MVTMALLALVVTAGPQEPPKVIATPPSSITGHELMLQGASIRDALNNEAIVASAEWPVIAATGDSIRGRSPIEDFMSALPTAKGPAASAIRSKADSLRQLIAETGNKFLYLKAEGSPIKVLADGAVGTVFLGPLASDTVFNTLRYSSRERAAKIATAEALPALRRLSIALRNGGELITHLAVMIAYGSRDFSSRSMLPSGEALLISVPAPMVAAFVSGSLTEDELLDRADVYLSDRDSYALRKIRVAIQ